MPTNSRYRHAKPLKWLALWIFGCNAASGSTDRTANPEPEPAASQPARVAWNANEFSDAPLSKEECASFGASRANDPKEPRSAEDYALECDESTAGDPPWMRRAIRCLLAAPTQQERKSCLTEQLVDERQAADVRLEAQIEEDRRQRREDQLREAEQILLDEKKSRADDPTPQP
ncbi:MAG: hypothetical protein JKY37_19755 [Nannocystaceae bacterium]|nr:hypothetical protein [Nannocystaceae bacterium]